jgi:mannose-6-phosphate isomerase-like protein (cupin superfamily)
MGLLHDTGEIREGQPGKPRKVNLVETDRFFVDVHVLLPGQAASVHTHAGEDKCYHVLSGRGRVTVGPETLDAGPGALVFCPAGEPHGVENPGPETLRLLVFMAPHPRLRAR